MNTNEKYFLITETEKKIRELYSTDKITSPVHLSFGAEMPSILVSEFVDKKKDKIFPSYRGHAAYLAHGGDLKSFFAELFGKKTGCSKGYGGSMHLISLKNGIQGTSAIVASHIPIAVGTAYTMKKPWCKNIVVVYFGDGATEEGVFWESLNLAELYDLPILFVCENNGFADSATIKKRRRSQFISEYIKPFFIPENILLTEEEYPYYEVKELMQVVRQSRTPAFLEYVINRDIEHVGVDGYKETKDVFVEKNTKEKILKNIEDAVVFAENSPLQEELLFGGK